MWRHWGTVHANGSILSSKHPEVTHSKLCQPTAKNERRTGANVQEQRHTWKITEQYRIFWIFTVTLSLLIILAIRTKVSKSFFVCPCNMIDIFIITNTMHTIGVDKITLFKTT